MNFREFNPEKWGKQKKILYSKDNLNFIKSGINHRGLAFFSKLKRGLFLYVLPYI